MYNTIESLFLFTLSLLQLFFCCMYAHVLLIDSSQSPSMASGTGIYERLNACMRSSMSLRPTPDSSTFPKCKGKVIMVIAIHKNVCYKRSKFNLWHDTVKAFGQPNTRRTYKGVIGKLGLALSLRSPCIPASRNNHIFRTYASRLASRSCVRISTIWS